MGATVWARGLRARAVTRRDAQGVSPGARAASAVRRSSLLAPEHSSVSPWPSWPWRVERRRLLTAWSPSVWLRPVFSRRCTRVGHLCHSGTDAAPCLLAPRRSVPSLAVELIAGQEVTSLGCPSSCHLSRREGDMAAAAPLQPPDLGRTAPEFCGSCHGVREPGAAPGSPQLVAGE